VLGHRSSFFFLFPHSSALEFLRKWCGRVLRFAWRDPPFPSGSFPFLFSSFFWLGFEGKVDNLRMRHPLPPRGPLSPLFSFPLSFSALGGIKARLGSEALLALAPPLPFPFLPANGCDAAISTGKTRFFLRGPFLLFFFLFPSASRGQKNRSRSHRRPFSGFFFLPSPSSSQSDAGKTGWRHFFLPTFFFFFSLPLSFPLPFLSKQTNYESPGFRPLIILLRRAPPPLSFFSFLIERGTRTQDILRNFPLPLRTFLSPFFLSFTNPPPPPLGAESGSRGDPREVVYGNFNGT